MLPHNFSNLNERSSGAYLFLRLAQSASIRSGGGFGGGHGGEESRVSENLCKRLRRKKTSRALKFVREQMQVFLKGSD